MPASRSPGLVVVHFQVPYMTQWGQHVALVGAGPGLGDWKVVPHQVLTCRHSNNELVWQITLTFPLNSDIAYKYVVVGEAMQVEMEEDSTRTLELPQRLEPGDHIDVLDRWRDTSHPACLMSKSAFADVILPRKPHRDGIIKRFDSEAGEVILRFRVWDWELQDGEELVVTGSLPQLGSWQPTQPLLLTETRTPVWEGEVRAALKAFPVTYKYAVRSREGALALEVGENRIAAVRGSTPGDSPPPAPTSAPPVAIAACGGPPAPGPPAAIVADGGPLRRGRPWRGAGVALPVFALRSVASCGCGEFLDLEPLADLAAATGLRLIQVLPVNDTSVHLTWWDSYPYSSVSVFALHPLYLRLDALAEPMPPDLQIRINDVRGQLNKAAVDYEGTMAAKLAIARAVFDRFGDADMQTAEFYEFYAAAEGWMRPYAVFGVLRGLFGTPEHWRWGALATPTPEVLERLAAPEQDHAPRVRFTYWLQWHLHRQLLRASRYAAQRRVALKGDLPIGVDKCSVDTWTHPHLFRMHCSTGAPPDYFDAKGQNWGFPTYDWDAMAADGFAWWRARLSCLAQYFHAYRIDHVLGFFRIWEIPGDCTTGLLGHFQPSHPLTRAELEGRGIWDFDRLCDPYITTAILEETFGALGPEVAAKYLEEFRPGRYRFRPQYASEAAIEGIAVRLETPAWLEEEVAATRRGLLALRHNVVLLRDPDSANAFFPRFDLAKTASFAAIAEEGWRADLAALHDEYLYRRQDKLWRRHALRTLPPLLAATRMLVCGEDLGFIPACVHPVMAELGLIGLRIQRMPDQAGVEFADPCAYPYMCVASPSCHDTSTTRAWWEEDASRRARFYAQALGEKGEAPTHCTPAVMRAIIQQHLDSPAIWAIFPLQDLLALSSKYNTRPAEEETINDPTVRRHYWRYRCHVGLEELLADAAFLADLRHLLAESGRALESGTEQHESRWYQRGPPWDNACCENGQAPSSSDALSDSYGGQ